MKLVLNNGKMVNGFRYYYSDIIERWKVESVSIASALSTALTKLQLPTARKEWRPAIAGSSPHAVTCQHWYTLL